MKKLNNNSDIAFYVEHGKIPPQAIDMEVAILGCLLIDKNAMEIVLPIIKKEVFYKEAHQHIYEVMIELTNNHEPIDILTCVEKLRKNGNIEVVGGAIYVSQLTRNILSGINIENYAKIILQKYINRELIRISSEIIKKAYQDEDELLIGDIEFEINKVYDMVKEIREPLTAQTIITNTLIEAREKQEQGIKLTGVPSGITALDRITLGWQDGDVIVIGARPSVGKTALALQFGINASINDFSTLLFSIEMTNRELAVRLLTNQTGVDYREIKTNVKINWELLSGVCNKEFTEKLIIDDSHKQDIYSMKNKIRKFKKKGGRLVIIDYLQLITGNLELIKNTNGYIGDIVAKLKGIAKELQIPIILLSQLSRDVEKRSYPFPILSDLRDSGEIEQHVDMVIFPTRFAKLQEKYQYDSSGICLKDKAVLDIAKHRNGSIDKIIINITEDKSKWYDVDGILNLEF